MEKTFKARIVNPVENGKNHGGNKELVNAYSFVVNTAKGMREVITVRVYMGRSSTASTVYASVWIRGKQTCMSGHGTAGGYGYHKESAAIGCALRNAGVELFEKDQGSAWCSFYIDGTGSYYYEGIFKAIARALGYSDKNTLLIQH